MNTTPGGEASTKSSPRDPVVAVTVLIPSTVIGRATVAAGAKLKLAKSKADVLASLTPPAVRIDGV